MTDIMGSPTLTGHQWRRHGSCTGLAAEAYLALSRDAFGRVVLPEPEPEVSVRDLAAAVLEANPAMPADGLVVTCRSGRVAELRVCLDRALGFRSCGQDVLGRACSPGRPLEAPPPR